MTTHQQRRIDWLREEILKHDGSDPGRYEYKRFEVDDRGSLVFVLSEVGLKNDEHSMASVFCRTRRNIAIGTRGGMRLLNARKKNVRGAACIWRLTQ